MRGRGRRTDQDDQQHGQPGRSRTSPQGTAGSALSDHVLGLQREYGNAAVTTVVQRRERPQSTDAPGAKKPPKPKPGKVPPTPVVEDFRPTKPHSVYGKWDTARIEGWIKDHGDDAKGLDAKGIAQMYDELYLRNPNWQRGINNYRAWSKVKGEEKRAKFWLDWFNSKGKLLDPKPESMVGKEF
jgi:hypothetical protein